MKLFRSFLITVVMVSSFACLTSCGSDDEASGATTPASSVTFASPGGFVEPVASYLRPRWNAPELRTFLPTSRGRFFFPPPYNTEAIRITDASDCGGTDCVNPVGYSYWRNSNAHVGSRYMWIFLGLAKGKGGAGPTLFRLDKSNFSITKMGPLFPAGSQFISQSGQGWYFSASRANKLYVNFGPKLLRYDVVTHLFDPVLDITGYFGDNRDVWQMHSSNDDTVHSATLRNRQTGEYMGCMVFHETTRKMSFFPRKGTFDECQIDMSGRFLMISDNVDGRNGLDNVFIDLQSGEETVVYDQNHAVTHVDMGYGYVVGSDNYTPLPDSVITWIFFGSFYKGPSVYHGADWNFPRVQHVSHLNAKPWLPMRQQFACGSGANRAVAQDEILCFRLDGANKELVVAPVMTDMNASGGGTDYFKLPKGNLDITGQYFIWTTNMGGNRIDAFIVKVPAQLLMK